MGHIRCTACPTPADCKEDDRCWNNVVTHNYIHVTRDLQSAAPATCNVPVQAPQRAHAAPQPPARVKAPAGAPARPTGGLTGRVWDIADSEAAKGLTGKDLRRAVIATCEQCGLNKSTASVQFGKWLSSQQN